MSAIGLRRAGHGPAALTTVVAALAVLPLAGAGSGQSGATNAAADALASLPVPVQAAISRVLGHDQRAYRVRAGSGGLGFENVSHRLTARFVRSGVAVRSGSTRLGISLRSLGYGDRLTPVVATGPTGGANRVSYRRGALTEWYVNGPLGLEQGFTLTRAPGRRSGPLTLELALSGAAPRLQGPTAVGFERSSLRYRGLFAVDARGKRVPAWFELRGRTLLVRVSDEGARYPLTIDPFLQQAKLIAAEAADDQFGYSVAVSGDTVAVGAPAADSFRGAAYVFVKPAGGWINNAPTARLTASDGVGGDQFGFSVAVSGDTVVAGALGATGGRGAAYVFVKPGGGWASATQTAKLTASDAMASDNLGYSVSVDGDTVVAGARNDDVSFTGQGSAYVFIKPGGGWATGTQTARLTASDAALEDHLGESVAVSGDTIVAGAPGANPGGNNDRGAAYVFVKPITGWANGNHTAKLTASDGVAGDTLGSSVSVSGNTVATGANGDDSAEGAVYVFVRPGPIWLSGTQTAKLTASDGVASDELGASVAIAGDTVAAGARGAAAVRGAAYVFVRPGGGWVTGTQTAKLTASDGVDDDQLGISVAVSADTVLAGASFATVGGNTSQGAAYVFVKPGGAWATATETAKLHSGGGNGDSLGFSIAVSSDTVVAGAPQADLLGNSDQGAVYVFAKPLSGWANGIQTAKLTASDGAALDQLGESVSISGDTVAAGAPGADLGDPDQGAAYVFVKPGGGWSSTLETAKLTASDGAGGDQLGFSVAVSGNTVAAGAPGADPADTDDGAAYVFVKPGGGWMSATQTAKLTTSDGAGFDRFGSSVGISGDTVVAGAPFADVGASDQGAAYVFVKPGPGWASGAETAKLTALDGTTSNLLGASAAVSGDTVVLGALGASGSQGAAYVFVKPGAGWVSGNQTAKLTASDGVAADQLGYAVAIDGDTVVAGAPNDVVGLNSFQGSAYVFVKPGAGWASGSQTEKLTAADGAAGDAFGHSVAIAGSTIAAGTSAANVAGSSDAGAAYVFVSSGPTAARLVSLTARRVAAGVVVRWRTANELGTLGFRVFRERGGKRVRLTGALIAASGTHAGRAYAYLDRRASIARPARYLVEAVQADRTRRWFGPIAVR